MGRTAVGRLNVWHPDADRLTLAALPAEPQDAEVVTHLAVCPLCREYVAAMRHTVELARVAEADTDVPPPPPRVWQAIVDELDAGQDGVQRLPSPPERVTRRAGRSSRWRAVAVPVAAAVIGVAAGLGVGIGIGMTPAAGTPVAQLLPLEGRDPGGTGTVGVIERDGAREMVVRLDGITDTAGADFLEAWLIDNSGTRLLSLGSLAQDGTGFHGAFTVPADLPMSDYSTVDISAEKWDGDPAHSRISLLRGPLT